MGAEFDAIVLAGGRSRRMGGVAKTALEVGGTAMLARVTAAVAGAGQVVLVGEPVAGARADVITREDPPGSGPVAALAAGLPHVHAPVVATLAGDLPFLTERAVSDLVAAVHGGAQRAVAVDGSGREQLLCAAWRTAALRAAVASMRRLDGAALRALIVAPEETVRLVLTGHPPPWWDCDDAEQLATARIAIQGDTDG